MLTLREICCSLQHAKTFKKCGVPQNGMFVWLERRAPETAAKPVLKFSGSIDTEIARTHEIYSAFTAHELMEILDGEVRIEGVPYYLRVRKVENVYFAEYVENGKPIGMPDLPLLSSMADTIVEALALLLKSWVEETDENAINILL